MIVKKVEPTHQPIVKENVVYPYNKMLCGSKRSEVPVHATTWMDLESMLSERSQSQKATYGMIPLI